MSGRPARLQDGRRADEVGDEPGGRALVDLARRPDLLDAAAVHHRDAVRERERLGLIVGHEDGGDPDRALDLLSSRASPRAASCRARPAARRAGARAAGRRARASATRCCMPRTGDPGAPPRGPRGARGRGRPARAARSPTSARGARGARTRRCERPTGGGRARRTGRPCRGPRRPAGDVLAVDDDAAGGGLEEAGDQVERRGLAAAGRTEQREQLALVHGESTASTARRPPKSRVHPLSSTTARAITGGGGTPPRDRRRDRPARPPGTWRG